jgi:hypothetical protein
VEGSSLYVPGTYTFTYHKALKDFATNKRLTTFDKKPTPTQIFERIFKENPQLVVKGFDENNLNIDYKSGRVSLNPSSISSIYDTDPFEFEFYTNINSVTPSTPILVDVAHPDQNDFIRALKKMYPDLVSEGVNIINSDLPGDK